MLLNRSRILVVMLAGSIAGQLSCNSSKEASQPESAQRPAERDVNAGDADTSPQHSPPGRAEALVALHCQACHLLPLATDLPKSTWPFVMDWMGNYLGHKNLVGDLGIVVDPKLSPTQPKVTAAELAAIGDYFQQNAPDVPLPQVGRSPHGGVSRMFTAPPKKFGAHPRLITMVSIDPIGQKFFAGDGTNNNLWEISHTGRILRKFMCGDTQPVALQLDQDRIFCTLMGDYRGETMQGTVLEFHEIADKSASGGVRFEHRKLISGFHRTSHSLRADVNGDGRKDFVLSGFGDHNEGALAWFEALPDGTYEKHILIGGAGALNTAAHDMDDDGDVDLLAMFAQGRNEMYYLRNDGDGQFKLILLWKRGPGFGYNGFQLVDFNADGKMDILAVNGNNMEIRDPPLKPYHGIRLHLNRGEMNFEETFFYPFYGAVKAIARDFDQDHDMDIAAISAFPDWYSSHPESFVYLQNQGDDGFRAFSVPETVGGRWLVMDAGDLDGDGDDDLVLGGGSAPPDLPNESAREKARKMILATLAVRYLENQTMTAGMRAGDRFK